MNTFGLMQSNLDFTLTLQETRIIHDSMNLPKIEFITYILYCLSSINVQLSYNLAVFLDILNYTNGGLGTAKTPNSCV